MKTIREWLSTLPEQVQERALRNAHNVKLGIGVATASAAVLRAFSWVTTPEGFQYWSEVHVGLQHRERLAEQSTPQEPEGSPEGSQ